MRNKTTRIWKEARSLFWPWWVVVFAGAPRVVEQLYPSFIGSGRLWGSNYVEAMSFLGFFLGIPLLATLPLGNEFQYRTIALLLSQPADRREIWAEKMIVTMVACLSAALVFCFGWRTEFRNDTQLWVTAGASIIAMIASAAVWTILARSTLGGLALNAVNSFIPIFWANRRGWIPESMVSRFVGIFLFVSYTSVMVWLGRRMLLRFQATGGMAGDDLLIAGSGATPGVMGRWLRCRPTGVTLNLIRKEVRLLRPVWLMSLLGLIAWVCLPVFRLMPERGSVLAMIMVVAYPPLIAVLAGSLSLGEERSSGTHSWHLTQPVPASRQWLVKLMMALLAGLVCAAVLPIVVLVEGGRLFGSPSTFVDAQTGTGWVALVLLLSFASFWCASAVNGTVRAAICVFPVIIALAIAGEFGGWIAPRLATLLTSKFEFFDNFRFTNAVSNINAWAAASVPPEALVALWLAPVLLVAAIQSRRLFRIQLQDNAIHVVRRLLPLAITASMWSFLGAALLDFADHGKQQMWTLFRETHEAIEKIQPGTPNLDAAHPLQLTAEDLAKASPLSERARRWLRGSRITVVPDKFHGGVGVKKYCCWENSKGIHIDPDKAYSWYMATVHLPSGSECTISFIAGRGFGFLGGVCE